MTSDDGFAAARFVVIAVGAEASAEDGCCKCPTRAHALRRLFELFGMSHRDGKAALPELCFFNGLTVEGRIFAQAFFIGPPHERHTMAGSVKIIDDDDQGNAANARRRFRCLPSRQSANDCADFSE